MQIVFGEYALNFFKICKLEEQINFFSLAWEGNVFCVYITLSVYHIIIF